MEDRTLRIFLFISVQTVVSVDLRWRCQCRDFFLPFKVNQAVAEWAPHPYGLFYNWEYHAWCCDAASILPQSFPSQKPTLYPIQSCFSKTQFPLCLWQLSIFPGFSFPTGFSPDLLVGIEDSPSRGPAQFVSLVTCCIKAKSTFARHTLPCYVPVPMSL